MGKLQEIAERDEDFAIHWRMEVSCDDAAAARFGDRLAAWRGESIDASNRLFIWKSHRHLGADVRYSAGLDRLGEMGPHAVLEIDPRLVPLVKRRFPSLEVVPRGAMPSDTVPPGWSYHATWERLNHYLLPAAAAMPTSPWLEADPDRTRRFARRLFGRAMRPRVALAWHSVNASTSLPSTAD